MFKKYEFLTVESIPSYIQSKPMLASRVDAHHIVSVEEIGDGNLNLVFIARDEAGRGLVLKQALPYVRMVGEGWPLTPERARSEATSLLAHRALVPELVVEVFDYNPDRFIIAMEDLGDHAVWRGALNTGAIHDGAADAVGVYIGAVAFGTSVFGMDRDDLAARQAESTNPQLCTITEDLVFTEPYVDAGRNSVLPANEPDAAELAADVAMIRAMGEAKWLFMTSSEALIHGDLHTGSVMVRAKHGSTLCDSVKVFDSEFAFYGPVAFDLGAVWANYVIAAARAYALGEDERGDWALGLIASTWIAFESEFRRRWPQRVDPRLWGEGFLDDRISQWRSQAWLFAAAKMARRIVGVAKTKDIETLPENLRAGAARGVLHVSRRLVVERATDSSPKALAEIARAILLADRTS
ncbi:S-methyl-5-thioribose kinase [Pengzhenrongella phosphoraccumulans]|uniref:S-methyl-5-thioribose kinase n=1 Tax=Pengzhenrongella phosphoraccumulans TaxID=3114394 RepID=UPI00388F5F59